MNPVIRKSLASILILTFILALPAPALAVLGDPDDLPPIPVSDKPLREKDVGITVFGYTIPGVTLDTLFIRTFVKPLIDNIVRDTIVWANTGFEGNPLYATDPGAYFTKTADNIAGKFIEGSDLGVLCTPFQAKIRLALLDHYVQKPQYQCTLTGVVGNIEAFYNNFAEGGWDGWFAMTQNDANNPYGAYITAKIDLDARIARKLNLEDKKLSWNQGYFDWADCIEFDEMSGECVGRGPTITPGKFVQKNLEDAFGTELKQLELADELDELLSAVVSGLLKKTLNNVQGLFR